MTGGRVVVIGSTGRNFAAGMSGGVAYVLDEAGAFAQNCNKEMVELYALDDEDEARIVHAMVRRHFEYTKSTRAEALLSNWDATREKIVKVLPNDYKRVREAHQRMLAEGMSEEEAAMAAFELNAHDAARVGGR
jgi:glutamate synthase (ferredoxin)